MRSAGGFTYPGEDYADIERILKKSKPPEMRKTFSIVEMHAKHHEIARRLVLGQKPKDIANSLGITYQSVIIVKNSPVVQEQIAILSGARDSEVVDVAKQIRDMAPKCLKVIEGIIDAGDDDVRVSKEMQVKTALSMLDRAGHAPQKNVNVRGIHAIVTPADLQRIKSRAVEIGITEGTIVDIESDTTE